MAEKELREMLTDLPDEKLRELLASLPRSIMKIDSDSAGKDLQSRLKLLSKEYVFAKGELVRWKKGLKNRKKPLNGEPAVVVEILGTPVFDESEKSAGSPYFREPLDLVVGFLHEDEEFILFHLDSRRFEPFQDAE